MDDNDLRARSEELFREIFEMAPGEPIQPRDHSDVFIIERAIADARAAGFAEAREMAARIAHDDACQYVTKGEVERAIRALTPATSEKPK